MAALANSLLDWGALCMLAPAWHYAGKLAQIIHLPLITGYLVGGIICGPYGINLLRTEALHSFHLVEHVCLAVIATAAGCEINFGEFRRTARQVVCLTIGIALTSWLLTYSAVLVAAGQFPFMDIHENNFAILLPVASLAATISMARSPASAIAILNEVSGKGPYCSLVMSVVIAKDLVTFIAFAVNMDLVATFLSHDATKIPYVLIIFRPIAGLLISALVGFIGNAALTIFLRAKMPGQSKPTIKWFRSGVVVIIASVCFGSAEVMSGEGLLACVVAGLLTVNKKTEHVTKELQEAVEGCLSRVMLGIQVLFFGLAGATLRLDQVVSGFAIALVLYLVRVLAIVMGSFMGAWAGGVPVDLRRRIWAGMVTQAGIALGLSRTIAARFPDWGHDFASTMAGVILLNLLTGPLLFKSAVKQMGEARIGPDKPRSKELQLVKVSMSDPDMMRHQANNQTQQQQSLSARDSADD